MTTTPLSLYLSETPSNEVEPAFVAYLANLTTVATVSPGIARSIIQELADQRANLKLIASENYCSLPTQLAMGNLLTDKYAEGFPGSRFYEGCDNVDYVEAKACKEATRLFNAEHAYVQPHSGADANMVAFWGILQARVQVPALDELGVKDPGRLSHEEWSRVRQKLGNQKLLGLNLAAGGHLTHGFRQNVSGKMFDAYAYGVSKETGLLDYDEIEAQAKEIRPLILLAGYSAYPRTINFKRMRQIADSVDAVLMVDMAHFAGLVAGGVFKGDYNPFPHAHVVTSTTHKTLRGPRGGVVLSTKEFGEYMDKGCPLVLGGPLPHMMAAKAIAFCEANKREFKEYAQNIVKNSQALAQACKSEGLTVVSGGTDNHLLLIDVTPFGLTGRQAAAALVKCGITLNKNAIPFDKHTPMITSGLRLGTPATTTLGLGITEMREIASIIKLVISNLTPGIVASGKNAGSPSKIAYNLDDSVVKQAKERVKVLLDQYPLYPELDLEFMQKQFA
ncbi:MAG: glycine hydroxymethyltransferase [Proteobacteria bacterium]|nr:glycine hydroxymethyltransferase [Pseudomonadota bacterium]